MEPLIGEVFRMPHETELWAVSYTHLDVYKRQLTQCATVAEAREKLAAMRLTGTAFSEQLPTAQLHWIIADKDLSLIHI